MSTESGDDLTIAREAMRLRDYPHALQHLGRVFVLSPGDETLQALLESVARETNLLQALPPVEQSSVADLLLRAWALRRRGALDEAVTLLAKLIGACPNRGFETILASWILTASARNTVLAREALIQAAICMFPLMRRTSFVHRLLPGELALMQGYGELAKALAPLITDDSDACMVLSGILRRCGHLDEAVAVVDTLSKQGDRSTTVQKAFALRASGDGLGAAALYAKLRDAYPDDSVYPLEVARSFFIAGDDAVALTILERRRDEEEVAALYEACKTGIEGDRVAYLDDLYRRTLVPPIDMPSAATANMIRTMRDQKEKLGSTLSSLSVSGWEPPSLRWLAALDQGFGNHVETVPYNIAGDDPDYTFLNRDPKSLALWKKSGKIAVQAVSEPPEAVRQAVARVAAAGPTVTHLWAAATALMHAPEAPFREHLLASMVYAPTDPAWCEGLPEILFRYQAAAACCIACSPDGWKEVGPILDGLVFGPIDWVSAAAIIATGELARRDTEAAHPARALLLESIADLVKHDSDARWIPLFDALSKLPGTTDEQLKHLAAQIAHDGEADHEVPAPPPPKPPAPKAPPRPAPKPMQVTPLVPQPPDKVFPIFVGLLILAVLYVVLR